MFSIIGCDGVPYRCFDWSTHAALEGVMAVIVERENGGLWTFPTRALLEARTNYYRFEPSTRFQHQL